jgi:hypothetical protein
VHVSTIECIVAGHSDTMDVNDSHRFGRRGASPMTLFPQRPTMPSKAEVAIAQSETAMAEALEEEAEVEDSDYFGKYPPRQQQL